MKRRWDRVTAVALLVVMGLLLTACGAPQTAETIVVVAAGTTVTVAVSTETDTQGASGELVTPRISWWGGDSRHKATEKTIQSFMGKYPSITADCEYGAWTRQEEKQSPDILGGECAGVIQTGPNWVTDHSKGGESYLDLYQAADVLDLSQFLEGKLKLNGVNGRPMAIPISLTGRLFYWNRTTFDEAGCSIPTDEASPLVAGKAFKIYNERYYSLALGGYDRMVSVVYHLESRYEKDWATNGVMNYTEGETMGSFALMNKPGEMHVLPSITTINGGISDSLDKNVKWIDGKYAGPMEWDSAAAKAKKAMEGSANKPGQEFQIGESIKFGDYQGGFAKVSMDLVIRVSTKYPKEAVLLVNYLLNDPEGVGTCSTEHRVPCSAVAVTTLNEKSVGDTMTKEANAKVADCSRFTRDPKFDGNELKANPDGIYYKVFGKLSSGGITPEDAAKTLIEDINEVFGNQKGY